MKITLFVVKIYFCRGVSAILTINNDSLNNDICMKLSKGYNLPNNDYSQDEYSIWTKTIKSHVV